MGKRTKKGEGERGSLENEFDSAPFQIGPPFYSRPAVRQSVSPTCTIENGARETANLRKRVAIGRVILPSLWTRRSLSSFSDGRG